MHPRSPYAAAPPDFAALAEAYPQKLARFVKRGERHGASIDFQDADATRALSETLLLHDFGVTANQRDDRLCPPIPNRANYVLWLQDLLNESVAPLQSGDGAPRPLLALGAGPTVPRSAGADDEDASVERPSKRARVTGEAGSADKSALAQEEGESVRILDVGTGASAIYALLGCALDERWRFTCTDIDAESIEHARSILHHPANKALRLASRVELQLRRPDQPLLPVGPDAAHIATMCNPPFYASAAEMQESADFKQQGPSAVCRGTDGEMITQGGEEAFVGRMIDESCEAGRAQHVVWFTSMLGKFSSVATIANKLRKQEIRNYALTEFVQGRTRRWAVAWTHQAYRLPDHLARSSAPSLGRFLAESNSHSRVLPAAEEHTPRTVMAALKAELAQLGQVVQIDAASQGDDAAGMLLARLDSESWTRGARRARAKALKEGRVLEAAPPGAAEPLLCLRCSAQWAEARREAKGAEGAGEAQDPDDGAEKPAQPQVAPPAPGGGDADMHDDTVPPQGGPSPRPVRVVVEWTYGREKQRAAFAACAESLLRRLEEGRKQT